MQATDWNQGWHYRHLQEPKEPWKPVELPHDAMLAEPRRADAPSEANSGWFVGRDYEYCKLVRADGLKRHDSMILEFEGVYQHSEVWLDDQRLSFHPYGYTGFFVDLSGKIRPGQSGMIRVVARNAQQPNSRWYSGAGIYRPVTLWSAGPQYLYPDGIRVSTLGVNPCAIRVSLRASSGGTAQVRIMRHDKDESVPLAEAAVPVDSDGRAQVDIDLPGAQPWSPENPTLYECQVLFVSSSGCHDQAQATFGIRTVAWGDQGLFINGVRRILKGACVHHDNGILGACAWPEAEERKVRLLKCNGYNAIRSAHNPCSKSLLAACDRLGMLILDEYADQWYIHKTIHDYAEYLPKWWRRDLADMVAKDFNHPSVIMYSIGNEVSETAQSKGVELTRRMVDFLHGQDASRPVTCGVNIFFNFLSSIGLGVYSSKKAAKQVAHDGSKRSVSLSIKRHGSVGSRFFNEMAGIMGADFMKRGATLPSCDRLTRDAFALMDVAGYNYGIKRYLQDLRRYPHRLILGTETFCGDADEFMRLASRCPRLIGDFVWAGMDYLGEVGVGAWEYRQEAPRFSGLGWLTAGSGRLDLTGRPLGEALYTRVALGGETGPYLAVRPVNHSGERHSPSAWKMTDALDSWSWDGCEGRTAQVEVYARAQEVVLMLNGRCLGRSRWRGSTRFRFSCPYEHGLLEALAYDSSGGLIGRSRLRSAAPQTTVRLAADRDSVRPGGLCFVRARYTDQQGIDKPTVSGDLTASVQGGRLLAFGCAAPYNPEGFLTGHTRTYYGQALAVVQADRSAGSDGSDVPKQLELKVSDGRHRVSLRIPIREQAGSPSI